MARKIVLTSGKGGVGKTTICANLGARLAGFGFRVVLVDVDIGLNNLDVVMGVENKIVFDIADVISAKCRVKQALVQDDKYPSLFILPSAHSYKSSCITGENIKNVLEMLDNSFDYILIDCPAGVEAGFHRAVFAANEAIIVVTPHISSIRDADKVLGILSSYQLLNKYLIVNRVRGDLLLSGEMLDENEIAEMLNLPLLGVIPEDDLVSALSLSGCLVKKGPSGRAFTLLSENLHNGTKKIYDCTNKYRGFWGGVRKNLRKKV
ncbi:MAG: septum site-determining protein MinD [Clostridia bacterium]